MKLPGGLLLLIAVLWGAPSWAAMSQLHHEIDAQLDPDAGTLISVDIMRISGRGNVTFALEKQFILEEMEVDGEIVPAVPRAESWSVMLDERPEHTVTIRYRGKLARMAPAHGSGVPDVAMGDSQGSFLPAGAGWYPIVDTPHFTYRINIATPGDQRAMTSGKLISEKLSDGGYRVSFHHDLPTDEIVLVAGPFEIAEEIHGAIRLRTYFHPEVSHLADAYLEKSKAYLDLYEAWIGAYPFPAFHVVSGPLPVGLGFANFTYIGTRVLRLPFIRETSLGHEVLHNWWGNGVGIDWQKGNWAEGLTTFMADYTYRLQESQEAGRERRLAWLRDFPALSPDRDQTVWSFTARHHGAAQVIGYNKVAFVFVMLRDEIGKATFDDAIRTFWRMHRFRPASWMDLQHVFEQVSGRGLSKFFEQWLERTGAPDLAINDIAVEAVPDGYRVSLVLSQATPAYNLNVPVRVATENGEFRRRIRLTNADALVSLNVDGRPITVSVDPDFELFRRLAPGESPPILRQVMLGADVVGFFPDVDPSARQAGRDLAARILDVGETGMKSKPSESTSPRLIIGTRVAVDELLVELGLPKTPKRLLVGTAAAWAGRENNGRPYLVVVARDTESIAALSRPLPHYGRRSYVMFEGAKAIDRGIWPSGDSPLTITLD